MQVHGSCVSIDGAAVLLRGPSASGKSDLALRLIDTGAVLVADDQVVLDVDSGRLMASAPAALAGLIEVRGIGIVACPATDAAPLVLVIDLTPGGSIERMPEVTACQLLGVSVPLLTLDPFEISAAARVRLALRRTHHGI